MQRQATGRKTSRPNRVIGGVLLAITLAACTGNGTATTSTSVGATVSTSAVASTVVTDGILRIGLLLPQTGPGRAFGDPLMRAAGLAIKEINDNGGVGGRRVEVVRRDEGADVASASQGLTELIEADADVIVGPASSTIALGILRQAVDAHRVVCSPTASAMSLSQFPDEGYFVRTISSDALQAEALAELISRSGRRVASVFYPDDDFGEGFEAVLNAALDSRGIEVDDATAYSPAADDLTAVVTAATNGLADLVVVIGEPVSGSRVIEAVGAATDAQVPIFVNDALRRTPLSTAPSAATRRLLSRVQGVSPQAVPTTSSPFLATLTATPQAVSYAAYAYDCVMLAALAAVANGSDDTSRLVAAMTDLSGTGRRCQDFKTCSEALVPGFNVDFNGASGRLELDATGEVTSAHFDEFIFDATGLDITVGQISINP